MSNTVRFGLICSGTTLPASKARCLEKLLAKEGVELALLVLAGGPGDRKGRWARAWHHLRRRDLLWTLYWRLVVRRRSLALRPIDMSAALADVPVLRVTTSGRRSEHFAGADIAEIRRRRLDFMLWFGVGAISGEILEAARYGVWSFHHDDEQRYRGAPPSFWEIYHSDPVTGTILQRLTDQDDAGIVLHRGFFRTIDESYVRNHDQAQFGSADWAARVCADIRNGNTAYLDGPPGASEAPLYRAPDGAEMGRFLVKLLRNYTRRQWWQLWRADHWNVGIVDAPIDAFLDGRAIPPVRWLAEPPRGWFMADPFGIADGERLSIFVEEFDYVSHQGRIVVVDPTSKQPLRPAMELETHHASYPFLFQHDGSIYCVPSLCPAPGVDLFRATDFPAQWERVARLVADFTAQDATVFPHEGRWWLLCTDYDDAPNARLHGWFAPDPAGSWEPHPLNPLKTDVRSSRSGGTPFVHEGCLYRPAQDDSRSYGGAVVLNRVLRLTPTEFEEETVARVDPLPGPYSRGLHTLSAAGDRTLVDGKRLRFAWPATRRQLRAKLDACSGAVRASRRWARRRRETPGCRRRLEHGR